jgi:hypothetical protein
VEGDVLDDEDMTNEPEFPEPSATENIGQGAATTETIPPMPPPPAIPQPVQRRKNGWAIFGGVVLAAVAAFFVFLIGLFAIVIAIVAGIASGDIDVDVDTDQVEVSLVPLTIDELPASITEESGEITVDLTELDLAELQAADAPVELDVRADFGSITVVVPEGLDVSVEASVDLGDLTVFDNSKDGFDNTIIRTDDDADMVLDLDLNVGKINVVQG